MEMPNFNLSYENLISYTKYCLLDIPQESIKYNQFTYIIAQYTLTSVGLN